MRASLVTLILLFPCLVQGQDVPLEVKGNGVKSIVTVSAFPFTVNAPPGAALYFWTYPTGVIAIDKGETLEIQVAPKGALTINVKTLLPDWESKKFSTKFGSVNVMIGEGGSVPIPPDPNPKPPVPDPKPQPISAPWVLMVYESADIARYPSSQVSVLYGKTVRDYLNSICPYESDGKTRSWRVWDKDQPIENESKGWQFMMNRPRATLPWISVGDGTRIAYEGPLPLTPQDTISTIKKALGIPFSQRDEKGYSPAIREIPIVYQPAPVQVAPSYYLPVSFASFPFRECPTCQQRR